MSNFDLKRYYHIHIYIIKMQNNTVPLDPDNNSIEIPYFINTEGLLPFTIEIPDTQLVTQKLDTQTLVIQDDFDYSDMPELIEITETPQVSSVSLEEIKRNIESTVNFSSVDEGLDALRNPDLLKNRIQGAFDSFKSQVGRNMTYSEMREMMG
jgi:hypothetical protein